MAMRDLILHNFWWKLLSLLLAALTWFTIQTALQKDKNQSAQSPVVTVSTRTFPGVPITLMTAAASTNQFRLSPPVVAVEVSGKADDLEKLQVSQIAAFVDVTKIEDEKEVRKDIQVQVPKGFKVEGFKPLYTSVERITTAK
ncbi:MAG: YbbR family protein [Pedosphaera sp.]|nr:YbbR family protein [Pedosphaera sp.]